VVERERLVPRARQASTLGAAISLVPTVVGALSALVRSERDVPRSYAIVIHSLLIS
jgi:hypothetical protein